MENIHQKSLRLWVTKGLSIDGIKNFKGDSKYLLNNMIAKYIAFKDEYMISKLALETLKKNKIDLNQSHTRNSLYGKDKPYIYEHAIPAKIVRDKILNSDCNEETIKRILHEAGEVCIILRTEDDKLKSCGLSSEMPDGWVWGSNPLKRYEIAKIDISNQYLKMTGNVKR